MEQIRAVLCKAVIVAAELTQQANDSQQLIPMIQQVVANVGSKPITVSADAGYGSAAKVTDKSVAGGYICTLRRAGNGIASRWGRLLGRRRKVPGPGRGWRTNWGLRRERSIYKMLAKQIRAARDRKLKQAREQRELAERPELPVLVLAT